MRKQKKNKPSLLEKILLEDEALETIPQVNPASTTQPMNISLDQKVDHFLMQYERESVPKAEMYGDDFGIGASLQNKTQLPNVGTFTEKKAKPSLLSRLFEADDPAADMDAGGDAGGGGDLGGADLGGDDSGGGGENAEIQVNPPIIDLDSFTERVARLINNHESLLDPKTVILNRTYVYLAKNYNEQVAKEMMIAMETKFHISGKTDREKEKELVGLGPFSAAGSSSAFGGGGG